MELENELLLFNEQRKPKRGNKTSKSQKFDWLQNLVNIGIDEVVAQDWLKVRKDKKATNTQTAFEFTVRELEKIHKKFGVSYTEAITVCVIRNWMGCRLSFFDNVNFAEYGIDSPTQKYHQENSINQNIPSYGKSRHPETRVRTFTEEDQQNTVF